MTSSPVKLILNGLDYAVLSQDSTRLVYEVVIVDGGIQRAPISVTVSAEKDAGDRAGWQCTGTSDDIQTLTKSIDTFQHKLGMGVLQEDYTDREYYLSLSNVAKAAINLPTIMGSYWANHMNTTRTNMLLHLFRVRDPLLSPTGPLQALRKKMEETPPPPALDAILMSDTAFRILPHRTSMTYSFENVRPLDNDSSGCTHVQDGDQGVISATPIKEAIQSSTRYKQVVNLTLRGLIEQKEENSHTRLVFGYFVSRKNNNNLPAPRKLRPLDDTHLAFSPVQTTPPFEISDAEKTEKLSIEVRERIRLMRMPRITNAAAQIAVADELIYRLVNRGFQNTLGGDPATIAEGALSNARSCVDDVTSTLLLSSSGGALPNKRDVLFHCLKGARGAWVLLRAAQIWERRTTTTWGEVANPDGARSADRLASRPPTVADEIKEIARMCAHQTRTTRSIEIAPTYAYSRRDVCFKVQTRTRET